MRPSKQSYYLQIAAIVASRGTCLRRNYGAVIVNNDQIVATGYTGAPRGVENCRTCLREELRIAKGERYELCRSVHAETNAVIHAGRDRCIGGTIYVVGVEVLTNATLADIPCSMCFRVLRNAGISEIVTLEHQIEVEGYREKEVVQSK